TQARVCDRRLSDQPRQLVIVVFSILRTRPVSQLVDRSKDVARRRARGGKLGERFEGLGLRRRRWRRCSWLDFLDDAAGGLHRDGPVSLAPVFFPLRWGLSVFELMLVLFLSPQP